MVKEQNKLICLELAMDMLVSSLVFIYRFY